MADAREIGARFVDAFNAHDEARIREVNGENGVFEAPGDVKVEGREAATEYAMAWLRAFPDARLSVHNEVAAGDWVVQECTFEGTQGPRTATSPPRTSGERSLRSDPQGRRGRHHGHAPVLRPGAGHDAARAHAGARNGVVRSDQGEGSDPLGSPSTQPPANEQPRPSASRRQVSCCHRPGHMRAFAL